ncbi:MAG: alpha/beta hydrolase, partial [Proteobacteria bacterium]|nr:alpha/beta hydrolase [Pseudomonadota bacterium]
MKQPRQNLIIFFHGFPNRPSIWDDLITALATPYLSIKFDCNAVLAEIDTPVSHEWNALDFYIVINKSLLNAYPDLEQYDVTLVGHDIGCFIAQFYAEHSSWYIFLLQSKAFARFITKLLSNKILTAHYRISGLVGDTSKRIAENSTFQAIDYYKILLNISKRRAKEATAKIGIPAHLIHSKRDLFVAANDQNAFKEFYAINPSESLIDAGHWSIVSHAREISEIIVCKLNEWRL